MADKIQDDAMQRYRQMYSKAQPESIPQSNKEKLEDNQTPPMLQLDKEESNSTLHKSQNKGTLDVFMKDKEKSLILLLILILVSEKADATLILALMYLII